MRSLGRHQLCLRRRHALLRSLGLRHRASLRQGWVQSCEPVEGNRKPVNSDPKYSDVYTAKNKSVYKEEKLFRRADTITKENFQKYIHVAQTRLEDKYGLKHALSQAHTHTHTHTHTQTRAYALMFNRKAVRSDGNYSDVHTARSKIGTHKNRSGYSLILHATAHRHEHKRTKIHTSTRIYAYTHKHALTHTHTHTHTHANKKHRYSQTQTCTNLNTHTHTHTLTYSHRTHMHVYIRATIYAYAHTHKHTHKYTTACWY
jgi:hypothetical protein